MRIVNQQKEIPGMISDLHTIFKQQSEETTSRTNLSIYLVVIGIHRIISLRRTDFDLSEGAQMLEDIFLDGPDVGIHTIMWSDTNKSMRRIFDKALNHFDMRVVQKMNPDDSHILIDSPLAGKLKDLQAFYYDYNHSDNLEKFKPYDLSNLSDFNTLFSQIRKKEVTE
ncbi:MAG: hypothetical protein GY795_41455 [Desulfobacterales bacterium]|nr:hypothetical protein [Desulfobacterales bacterium]